MSQARLIIRAFFFAIGLCLSPAIVLAESVSVDEFRRDMINVPLCGTPTTGPLAGKSVCTVHLRDGTAILAGSGFLVRGQWDIEGRRICRRGSNVDDAARCIEYEKIGPQRYRNSDGVEVCIGPCS